MLDTSIKLRSLAIYLLVLFYVFVASIPSAKADMTANLAQGDALSLIGIGMYQELRNDIYLGALYGPDYVDNVEQLKDDAIAKRMSLRFVSKYSNRKLARHWKERMAMNNSRSQWQPYTREIVEFSKLFKREFEPGDEINIDHLPGIGTQVYLNTTLFTTISKPGFADILLNVWLGNIPPTKAFKASIRGEDGQSKTNLLAQYSLLQPVKGRFDADKNAPLKVAIATTETKKPPKKAAKKPAPKTKKATTPAKVVKKPPVVNNKPTKKEAVASTEKKTTSDDSNAKVATSTEKTENLKVAAVQKKVTTQPANQKAAQTQKQPPKKVAKLETPPVEELFDADLITGSYTRDLINHIRQHQEYPKKAYMRGDEGDVTAKVTLGTTGEIITVEIIERSGSRILDRAVSKMIKKAAPFEPIPQELKQQEFVFSVPISFKL